MTSPNQQTEAGALVVNIYTQMYACMHTHLGSDPNPLKQMFKKGQCGSQSRIVAVESGFVKSRQATITITMD